MGHLNDHDPADTRAITRSRLGLNRETQRFRTGHYPHPSRGGTRGQGPITRDRTHSTHPLYND